MSKTTDIPLVPLSLDKNPIVKNATVMYCPAPKIAQPEQ
jgi:hypothetical protein